MLSRRTSSPAIRTRTVLVAAASAAVVASGCGGERPAVDASAVPLASAVEAGGRMEFSGRIPALRSGAAPEDTLRMVRSIGDTVTFGLVTRLRAVGPYLVTVDRFTSPHMTVFDRSTGALISRFGRDGEGPGEFRDPSEVFVLDHERPEFWVYDFHNRRAARVELGARGEAAMRNTIAFNVGAPIETLAWIGGGIVASGLFPDYTLLLMDSEGVPQQRVSADPPFQREIQNTVGGRQANRSFAATSPARDRLVLAYQWRSRLDFFTARGERYGTVSGPREVRTRHRVTGNRFEWAEGTEVAYWATDATDEHVFALFCGCDASEGDVLPDRLHVFRWNGDFVAEVALDRSLMTISVSPDGRRLYGAFLEPEPGVGEWELPPFD